MKTIRIGGGAGFSGDRIEPAVSSVLKIVGEFVSFTEQYDDPQKLVAPRLCGEFVKNDV